MGAMCAEFNRFDVLFEHSGDAIALLEVRPDELIVQDANPKFEEVLPSGSSDIIGRDFSKIVSGSGREQRSRGLSSRVADGELVTGDLTVETVDGSREYSWKLVPMGSAGGNSIQTALAIFSQVPDRGRDQERFQAFIEQSTDIITVLDADGTYVYQSPSSERILGYPPDELLGDNAFDYVHPEDRQRVKDTFYEAVESPSRRPTVEYRFRHDDGTWVWLESHGKHELDNPAVEGFVVNTRDITAHKERARELEQVRNRMEFALQSTEAMVWDWNVDDDRASFYPAEENLYGESVDSFDDFLQLIHPEDRRDARESIERALETGESKHEEIRIVRDGEVRWLEAPGRPIEEDDGTTRMIGVARDITDQKRREREIERQNERLDQFASVVSHDLRNPLNVADGRLELALEECDSEHLETVARTITRMETLVDDMLSLARAGQSIGETGAVELKGLVEACWETVRTGGATLVVETDATIRADETRLKQLLENLLRNAVEHGGDDGTITVGDLPDGFYVEDDGPGIPEERRTQVFEPGFSTSGTGSGLGLTIVRDIAEAHDWQVTISSGTNGGARFEFGNVPRV